MKKLNGIHDAIFEVKSVKTLKLGQHLTCVTLKIGECLPSPLLWMFQSNNHVKFEWNACKCDFFIFKMAAILWNLEQLGRILPRYYTKGTSKVCAHKILLESL